MNSDYGLARLRQLAPIIVLRAPCHENATLDQWKEEVQVLRAKIGQSNEEIRALRDIVIDLQESQTLRMQPVAREEIDSRLAALRELWVKMQDASRPARITLAILHGLLEMADRAGLDPRSLAFFDTWKERIEQEESDAAVLENQAAALGLPVCEPREHVQSISADFGIVEDVMEKRKEARVILWDERDEEVKADIEVQLIRLPAEYREQGAGIALVRRHYALGTIDRFEPASAAD